ncbi:hypothetical protein SLEP1_g47161 [Rubroshorea leprosula]|uniref:Uncharacterized protein n=1 Tax=Rubroshorea leprosula TaxID=152421 RepID=A0AAV5LQD5_9ROSI|nr:hypothetical protein SLEP1_g47161 [Rubroshorea leprosula]
MKNLLGRCAEGVVFLGMSGSIQSRDCLFSHCPNDHKRFFPNHASKVHQLHLDYFRFARRVIALALMHKPDKPPQSHRLPLPLKTEKGA